MLHSVSLSKIEVGTVLTRPIYDPIDPTTLLLGRGIAIDDVVLGRLKKRGLRSVIVDDADLRRLAVFRPQGHSIDELSDHNYQTSNLETDTTRQLDDFVERASWNTSSAKGEPLVNKIEMPGSVGYDRDQEHFLAGQHEHQIGMLESMFAGSFSAKSLEIDLLEELCMASLKQAIQDPDLFACLAVNPHPADYPTRHLLHVSQVAIAMGINCGLDNRSLYELGLGCMLHDIGMLRLETPLFRLQRSLNAKELADLAAHPVLLFDVLERGGKKLPTTSQLVAYQMHERCNGKGYPRGYTGNELHPLSKLAGLADSYTGLVAPRPHRPGLMPYYAIIRSLNGVRDGYYDPHAMRALLRTISMFPIGSFVELSDGRRGRVIRANGRSYDRPMVETWDQHRLDTKPVLTDLANEDELKVVRPLAKLS